MNRFTKINQTWEKYSRCSILFKDRQCINIIKFLRVMSFWELCKAEGGWDLRVCTQYCRLNGEIDINVFFGAAGVMRNDRDIIPVCNLSKHWQRWCGDGHRAWQGWALSSSPCLNGIYVRLAPMTKIQFATLCRRPKSNFKMTAFQVFSLSFLVWR